MYMCNVEIYLAIATVIIVYSVVTAQSDDTDNLFGLKVVVVVIYYIPLQYYRVNNDKNTV